MFGTLDLRWLILHHIERKIEVAQMFSAKAAHFERVRMKMMRMRMRMRAMRVADTAS